MNPGEISKISLDREPPAVAEFDAERAERAVRVIARGQRELPQAEAERT